MSAAFTPEALEAVARQREFTLTTFGRKTGLPVSVTIWIATDGSRVFIRSGAGLGRHWPQNLLARGEGVLNLDDKSINVKPRLVTDPDEARAYSRLIRAKYGPFVRRSKPNGPLTPGEQATFELLPA